MERRPGFPLIVVMVSLAFFSACSTPVPQSTSPKPRSFQAVDDFLYQLRDADLSSVKNSRYDLAVVDYSSDGTDAGKWKAAKIAELKNAGMFVFAYLSVGEAEKFRSYWQSDWTPGYFPAWLGKENPASAEKYRVKYWEDGWKGILKQYLSEIVDQGFDGVYLAGVELYEYWSEGYANGENEELSLAFAADRMAALVKELADYVRNSLGKSDFIICPQNGGGLLADADYDGKTFFLDAVDAAAEEDVYFPGEEDEDNAWSPTAGKISAMDEFKAAGKKVLVVEYLSKMNTQAITAFYQEAEAEGYVPFATSRALDELRVNSGFEPD